MNYFSLFDLPVSYSVDINQLSLRYQELQRQFHPDRYASASESDKVRALQQAATINDAYQTLKHPLNRAEYLLSLQYPTSADSEQHTMKDTGFLMQQLELREELTEIEHQANVEQALLAFSQRVDKMMQQKSQQLSEELAAGQWEAATDSVRKLRFLDKLQQQIDQLEERLLDF